MKNNRGYIHALLISLWIFNSSLTSAATKSLTDDELEEVDGEFYGGSPEEIQKNIDRLNAPSTSTPDKLNVPVDTSGVRLGDRSMFWREDMQEATYQEAITGEPQPGSMLHFMQSK